MGAKVTLSILGGGSWGTALAIVLAPRFERLRLWVFEPDLALRMTASRENDVFLPGLRLPENIDIEMKQDGRRSRKGFQSVLRRLPKAGSAHICQRHRANSRLR